ncbi:MAG TPA: hypothetical protein DCL07_00035 [Cryomorphaceae bacterium]|jgi:hypothetical protein|nr:MAG: hypothetical protein ABR98_03105 [Cryomorphaceae bacterium BACL7 MAG-120910-bin2]KRO69165.1 MAG: hypothetical protein ABR88_03940 [Cryomorphaceae bacterium BACL7 MAG-120322-bin74]KRO83890.1 MAG: hypothetical protein ABR87_05295 [Cryomorphaceae bacterium BACL7 MAG-121220-bin83]HAB31732.1 hypothetical protein [Cryomorphaceae bacterium]HAG48327.1 hypothetical protein [Cryomorphaceae bacterium]
MKRRALIWPYVASILLSSCGLMQRGPKDITMETPPPRPTTLIAMEALQAQFGTARMDTLFYRAKGSIRVQSASTEQKARLEMRIHADPIAPQVWLDIADPFVGLKLARVNIDADTAQGYAHIINKVVNEPIARLENAGIPVSTMDLVHLLTGEPMAIPTSIIGMELTATMVEGVPVWDLRYPVQRGEHMGTLSLTVTQQAPHHLLTQSLSVEALHAKATVEYRTGGAWTAVFDSPEYQGGMQFEPNSAGWQAASLSFPFSLPSGYARVEL